MAANDWVPLDDAPAPSAPHHGGGDWVPLDEPTPPETPKAEPHLMPHTAGEAVSGALAPITSIPSTYRQIREESLAQADRGVGQIKTGQPWEVAKGIGNVALGDLGYLTSPISAPLRTIVNRPIASATKPVLGEAGSEFAGNLAEAGAGFALPVPKGVPRVAKALPEEVGFGVTGSQAELTGTGRQIEQNALRNEEPHAVAWKEQREGSLGRSRDIVAEGLHPEGKQLAETPQEAGSAISSIIQDAEQKAKAGVDALYQTAGEQPGMIHRRVFEGIGDDIKADLYQAENPVVVSEKTTPHASQMVDYLDNKVSALLAPRNKAVPAPTETIAGVNLNGVDQLRRELATFRDASFRGGTGADQTATQEILKAFDKRVDQAVNSPLFTGDAKAIEAWNEARAAHADYRATFGGGRSRDPVGKVVQNILGDAVKEPMEPIKVVDQLSKVAVANRVKTIVGGEGSPGWAAAKQATFRDLVEAGKGETAYGTGKAAGRLSKYLNSDAAAVMFSPNEQEMLREYASMLRRITPPAGTYQPSAPGHVKALGVVARRIGMLIGATIGHTIMPGLGGEMLGAGAGHLTTQLMQGMQQNLARRLPLVNAQMQQWSRAQSALAAAKNAPASKDLAIRAARASSALERTLSGIEQEFRSLQSPALAGAGEQDQQNVPGPPSQKKHGGRIGEKQNPAHDGNMGAFDPSSIGARKAKNNHWFVNDPSRPGKYLLVLPKGKGGTKWTGKSSG